MRYDHRIGSRARRARAEHLCPAVRLSVGADVRAADLALPVAPVVHGSHAPGYPQMRTARAFASNVMTLRLSNG